MTWVKKLHPDWQPQEHPNIVIGDIVDFPGSCEKLLQEGFVVLCTKEGVELSTYETTGKITEREMNEFRAWVELKKNERLKKELEKQIVDTKQALSDAATIKASKQTSKKELTAEEIAKKKAFADKMQAAKAKKRAERLAQGVIL